MRQWTGLAFVFIALSPGTPASASSCEALTSLALPQTTITVAAPVAAGAFAPPGPARQGGAAPVYATLPAFCRVAATLKPSGDSDIKIEVWMPVSEWNGKFQAVGNGGWTGSIPYAAMLRRSELDMQQRVLIPATWATRQRLRSATRRK